MPSFIPLAAAIGVVMSARFPLPLPQQSPDAMFAIAVPAADAHQVVVWRQPPSGAAEAVNARTSPGDQPGMQIVSVACVEGDYVVQAASRVSQLFRLDVGRCGQPTDVPLFPAASIRGRIRLPADPPTITPPAAAAAPRAGTVVAIPVLDCADGRGAESAREYRVRPEDDGQFAAVLPAGCLVFALRVEPYAPIPRSRATLNPHEVRDLGTIEMKRGATLVVVARHRGEPAAGATIWAVPIEGYASFIGRFFALSFDTEEISGIANSSGVVAFVGVPPALIHVAAKAQERVGFAGPVELRAGAETDVDAVELFGPSSANVTLAGDSSWVEEPLRVSATALPDSLNLEKSLTLGPGADSPDSGTLRFPVPGRWRFDLESRDQLLDRLLVDIAPETATPVQLSVERFRFRGRVFVGSEPSAGALSLFKEGAPESAAHVETDADGRFTVRLPEPGAYTVLFSREQDGIRQARSTAEFSSGVEAAVRFAPTHLEGTVGFGNGRLVRNAVVKAERVSDDPTLSADSATAVTDANGGFVIRGLEPGPYDVSARLGARKSDSRRVVVGEKSLPVQLVLPDIDGLVVNVVNPGGEPLPLVHGWLIASTTEYGAPPQTETFETDAEGSAKVAVWWGAATRVHVALTDADRPVAAFRSTPANDGTVTVAMPAGSGQVRVTRPAGATDGSGLALLGDRGGLLPFSLLIELGLATEVTVGASTAVVIPSLASGRWQVVRFADTRALFQYYNGAASPGIVASFSLAPGGNLVVELGR